MPALFLVAKDVAARWLADDAFGEHRTGDVQQFFCVRGEVDARRFETRILTRARLRVRRDSRRVREIGVVALFVLHERADGRVGQAVAQVVQTYFVIAGIHDLVRVRDDRLTQHQSRQWPVRAAGHFKHDERIPPVPQPLLILYDPIQLRERHAVTQEPDDEVTLLSVFGEHLRQRPAGLRVVREKRKKRGDGLLEALLAPQELENRRSHRQRVVDIPHRLVQLLSVRLIVDECPVENRRTLFENLTEVAEHGFDLAELRGLTFTDDRHLRDLFGAQKSRHGGCGDGSATTVNRQKLSFKHLHE